MKLSDWFWNTSGDDLTSRKEPIPRPHRWGRPGDLLGRERFVMPPRRYPGLILRERCRACGEQITTGSEVWRKDNVFCSEACAEKGPRASRFSFPEEQDKER